MVFLSWEVMFEHGGKGIAFRYGDVVLVPPFWVSFVLLVVSLQWKNCCRVGLNGSRF